MNAHPSLDAFFESDAWGVATRVFGRVRGQHLSTQIVLHAAHHAVLGHLFWRLTSYGDDEPHLLVVTDVLMVHVTSGAVSSVAHDRLLRVQTDQHRLVIDYDAGEHSGYPIYIPVGDWGSERVMSFLAALATARSPR